MYTAATGMKAQQLHVDAISNNLANVNTNGFKRAQPTFQDLLYVTLKGASRASAFRHRRGRWISMPGR